MTQPSQPSQQSQQSQQSLYFYFSAAFTLILLCFICSQLYLAKFNEKDSAPYLALLGSLVTFWIKPPAIPAWLGDKLRLYSDNSETRFHPKKTDVMTPTLE